MQRRDSITFLGGVAAWPLTVRADERALVGVLWPSTPEVAKPAVTALGEGLKDSGFVEGSNLTFALRYANGDLNQLGTLGAELSALKPAVIIASTNAAIVAALGAAPTVPLVGLFDDDPVALGFVKSYARPGGTVTGPSYVGGDDSLTGFVKRGEKGIFILAPIIGKKHKEEETTAPA